MNEVSLKSRLRWIVPVIAGLLCLTAAIEAPAEIDKKLSEGREPRPADQVMHDEEVRTVLDFLWQTGSLATFADAERLLREQPDLLWWATTTVSDALPQRAMGGFTSAEPTADSVDTEAILGWRNPGLFETTAAVLGNDKVEGQARTTGALGAASAVGSFIAGVYGATLDTGSSSYGVHGWTEQPQGIAVYARHDGSEDAASGQALYVSGIHKADFETPDGHAALIENRASEWPSVLALRMSDETTTSLLTSDNFVTFFARNAEDTADVPVGAIEGNASGGVQLNTSGSDIAEYIERLDPEEELTAGDVVGVADGKVTRDTAAAQQVMVISSGAAVAGNAPAQGEESRYSLVSFVGQVPVKVRGPVKSGDFIVASGLSDGCGMAVDPEKMSADDYRLLLGRAWETSGDEELRLVKVAVGQGESEAFAAMQERLEARLAEKEAQLERLQAQMRELARQMARLEGHCV